MFSCREVLAFGRCQVRWAWLTLVGVVSRLSFYPHRECWFRPWVWPPRAGRCCSFQCPGCSRSPRRYEPVSTSALQQCCLLAVQRRI